MSEISDNPYVKKGGDGNFSITREGHAYLARIVTDTNGPVYGFTDAASPLLVAAAMARLSRRGDDMRVIWLDEFALAGAQKGEALMDRVVTAYGDDSVAQLGSFACVVEGASNILTKVLEWGRIAAYLEQSTRYIFFDEKDSAGNYKYFVPKIPDKVASHYRRIMDEIFGLYSEMVRGLTEYVRNENPQGKENKSAWLGATRAQACDAARPVLPAATKSTVGIVCSPQAIDSLIRHLFAHQLKESQETGRVLLREARKVIPSFLKRTDMPERGIASVLYMQDTERDVREFAAQNLSGNSIDTSKLVRMVDCYPAKGRELDIVPRLLFSSSRLSLAEIESIVSEWSEKKKLDVLEKYVGNRKNRRHKPGRAFEFGWYEFEVLADYGTFRDLQRHRMVDGWEWQDLIPDYGYDIPALVNKAGFEDVFVKCFKLSGELFAMLKEAGFAREAQYATLLGHKMRYKFAMNWREAFHMIELRTQPAGHPGYRKICQEMHRLISEVHPSVAAAMKFVNQGGDPELTRLEAERATQKKLELL